MNSKEYQSWEDEYEAPELDEEAQSVIPMLFAAVIGICIFSVLILRTMFQQLLKPRTSSRRSSALSSATGRLEGHVAQSK